MQTDDFFEEEADLARDQVVSAGTGKNAASGKARKTPAAPSASPARSAAKPPSFMNVVLIALAALILGIGIGYFIAMTVVDRTSSSNSASVSAPAVTMGTESQDIPETGEMPSGHPDISSMMNPDGSINEEAVAQYKAERAAERAAQEAAGQSDASGEGDDAEGAVDES